MKGHNPSHWRRALFALGLAASPAIAAPGAPQIDWMETSFAIIEVDDAATAYENLVTVHDYAEVPVAWTKWSGDDGDTVQYLLRSPSTTPSPRCRKASRGKITRRPTRATSAS